jgi:hypothetical protein
MLTKELRPRDTDPRNVHDRPPVTARVEHLVTSGTFSLDGQTFDVDNNVWLLGDDDEVLVIDAPHDPDAIAARSAAAAWSRSPARTPTTTTSGRRPSWPSGCRRRCCCTPTTGCCGT